MRIEDQVCTVWQGQTLREMGIKAKSQFTYIAFSDEFQGDEKPAWSKGYESKDFLTAPAFTVSELFQIIISGDIKYRTALHERVKQLVIGGNYDSIYDPFELAEIIISFSDNPNH